MSASTDTRGAIRGSRERLPDFFILGHPKCGTTALYEMLRQHPRIYMPELKEPWFFASDLRPRFQPARAGATPGTLSDYLSLFAGARPEQRAGEASSFYLSSQTAAEGIARMCPDARLIAILREPASFLRSLHLQLLRDHIESERDLGRALALEPARTGGREIPRRSHLPQLLLYSRHVRYVEQLRRYGELFARERLLVLIYDDFLDDNEGTLGAVLRFLELEGHVAVRPTTANATVRRMRSQRLDELLGAVSVGRGPISLTAKRAIKTLTPAAARSAALKGTRRHLVYGRPDPPDERLMLELRGRFRDEVVALSEYLERDLVALWGYDSLD